MVNKMNEDYKTDEKWKVHVEKARKIFKDRYGKEPEQFPLEIYMCYMFILDNEWKKYREEVGE